VSHPGCKRSFVLSSRQDAGRQAHRLLPGEMMVATPEFPLAPPGFLSVGFQLRQALATFATQGSPQLCSTFSR
jgi:hypothetical protein